jgi:hypothetical protein
MLSSYFFTYWIKFLSCLSVEDYFPCQTRISPSQICLFQKAFHIDHLDLYAIYKSNHESPFILFVIILLVLALELERVEGRLVLSHSLF